MTERFPLRPCWATRFLWPLTRGTIAAEVGDGAVRIRLGWLGGAELPVGDIARLSRMNWPWWGGIGARLGRGLVAYTTSWGEAALIEMNGPLDVRAPLRWKTRRVVISVDDVDGFLRAVARERGAAEAGEDDA